MLGQQERGVETVHTLEKIQALDKVMAEPLDVTEEQLLEAVGEDEEKRKRIAVFLMHHEMLRQEGAWVPHRLNNGQLRWIFIGELNAYITSSTDSLDGHHVNTTLGKSGARGRQNQQA